MLFHLFCAALLIGSDFVQPPFAFTRSRKKVGFEVDLARAIAKQLECEIEFVPQDEADLIIGGNVTTAAPYMTTSLSVLVDTKKRPQITSFADLKGKRIGVQEAGLDLTIGTMVHYPINKTLDAIVDLMEGEIDAFLKIQPAAFYLSFSAATIQIIDQVPDYPVALGFEVRDLDLQKQISDAQVDLEKSGVLQDLYNKWFPR